MVGKNELGTDGGGSGGARGVCSGQVGSGAAPGGPLAPLRGGHSPGGDRGIGAPSANLATSQLQEGRTTKNSRGGGRPVAQWKLGRMYADGDGVAQDDLRAFEYFSRIANAHAEDSPSAPQATIVANAFVALGRYYLNGIPNSKIKSDPERAREMFSYAASYFGNADAQNDLPRLYLRSAPSSRSHFP